MLITWKYSPDELLTLPQHWFRLFKLFTKSVGLILWGPWISVQSFMLIHPVVAKIFQSNIPWAALLAWLRSVWFNITWLALCDQTQVNRSSLLLFVSPIFVFFFGAPVSLFVLLPPAASESVEFSRNPFVCRGFSSKNAIYRHLSPSTENKDACCQHTWWFHFLCYKYAD